MKPMHIAMALFSAAMFFVLAGVFMGVQLELDVRRGDLFKITVIRRDLTEFVVIQGDRRKRLSR
ncbi:hypothetical protein JFZ79_002248 [Salmonella enterica]|nr:hypothetical protein [Salmonella enterica]